MRNRLICVAEMQVCWKEAVRHKLTIARSRNHYVWLEVTVTMTGWRAIEQIAAMRKCSVVVHESPYIKMPSLDSRRSSPSRFNLQIGVI
jgi:hypothetical protein